jgi:hypothetical protein
MGALKVTSIADCEIIIKAFEKAAIYSNDPKSVYAMTTPVISRIRSDASNAQNQLELQFDTMDRLKVKGDSQNRGKTEGFPGERMQGNSPQYTGMAFATSETEEPPPPPAEPNQKTDAWDSIYGSQEDYDDKNFGQKFMHDCVPCLDRIRNAEDFHNKFWLGDNTIADQWLGMMKQQLVGAMQKLVQMVNMFRDLGSGAIKDICGFLNLFSSYKCPSDLILMVKALSGLLVKISIDLMGDMSFLMDIVAALIGPIISSLIQMLKNYVMAIIDPIWCIIDHLQKNIRDVATVGKETMNLMQEIGESELGLEGTQSSEVAAEGFWKGTLPDVDPVGKKISSVKSPWTGKVILPGLGGIGVVNQRQGRTDIGSASYQDGSLMESLGSKNRDISYHRFLELDQKKSNLEKLLEDGKKINQREYKTIEEEWDRHGVNKVIRATDEAMDWVDKQQSNVTSIITTVTKYLMEMALWIENFLRDWLKEFGRLIGDSFTLDVGFLKKQSKKLTTLQLISVLMGAVTFITQSGDLKERCSNQEALQQALTSAFGFEKLVVQNEDGSISIVDSATATEQERQDAWDEAGIDETENTSVDALTTSLESIFTSPTEMVFSCNRLPSSLQNAAQVNKWIEELNGTSV